MGQVVTDVPEKSLSQTLLARPVNARPLPTDPGHPSVRVMAHGSMEVRWFIPQNFGEDHAPHDRDELYFVVSGTATFCRSNEAGPFDEDKLGLFGEERLPVEPGDVLFVPAGAAHHFRACSPDFGVWAVFYGPEGGEPD